jgi:DHA1 family bicyclomycin/chloramphenicol resistance-like MFS transporter
VRNNREQAVGPALAAVLCLLTVFGPISMDLYLPVLPALTAELGAATSTAQLTITTCLLGAAGLLATATLHLPLIAVILSLFTMVSGVAATTPPATSLALTHYPHIAGTASSLLGMARFAFGGLAAPIVGLGGADNALPLGLVTVASTLLAALIYVATIRQRTTAPTYYVAASSQPRTTTVSRP